MKLTKLIYIVMLILLFSCGMKEQNSMDKSLKENDKLDHATECSSGDFEKEQWILKPSDMVRHDSITYLAFESINSPWNLGGYPMLKSVSINGCSAPLTFEFLKESKCLERLILRSKDINSLKIPFESLKEIKDLTISIAKDYPNDIFDYANIKELDLTFSNNQEFKFIWEKVWKLRDIERLSISFSSGSEFKIDWNDLTRLKKIKSLYINNIKIDTLPDQIINLKNLQYLTLDGCNLKVITDKFGELSNLKELDFRNNKIEKLPESFGALKNLKTAMLDYNLLTELPDSFIRLDNLNKIQLSNNKFELFPEELLQVKNIQGFTIHENKIDITPELISKCTKAFKGKIVEWYLEKPDYEKE